MWLRAFGLSQYMTEHEEFRSYARGYDARAVFPDKVTIRRLAECTLDLQKEARTKKIALKHKIFKGKQCIGLQLDMWYNSDTQTAFAAITMTTVEEPTSASPTAQLDLESDLLDFEEFPYNSKTGELIRLWLNSKLEAYELVHSLVAGVCPDGAADGQCGLSLIETLAEKVNTCDLHILQRAILFALGLAGASSKSPEAKAHLKKHNRAAMLARQSGPFLKSIKGMQTEAGVPEHKILVPERTAPTRWGNQFVQAAKNCTLRPAIDPSVEKFKKENKGNKEALVETNDSEQGSKVGTAVAATELGLSPEDWEESQEMEGFLSYPFDIKETIEKRPITTGAQAMALFYDLKENFCNPNANLSIKALPTSLALADRERPAEMKDATDLCEMIHTARSVLKAELQSRKFDLRPSNTRLVQCYMSKQMSARIYLSEAQYNLAKTCYMQMLRAALEISRVPTRSSPPRLAKKPKTELQLFRGSSALPTDTASPEEPTTADDYDPVVDEAKRWENLAQEHYQPFIGEDGLLNEFAMMWALRERFPLHLIVFKQTACDVPHEGGVENLFSRAGLLSDSNMDPHFLAVLTSIAVGKAAYNPPYEKIKAKYFEKFRGKGGVGDDDDEGTTVKSGEAGPSSAAGPSQACASPSCSDAGLLPFGLLRATPPRPLFSRTPSPTHRV